MLIDRYPVESLPYWLLWLDWCFYAYWPALILSAIFTTFYHFVWRPKLAVRSSKTKVTITIGKPNHFLIISEAFLVWLIFCLTTQGYPAVG